MFELCVGKSMSNICRLALVKTTKNYSELRLEDIVVFKGHDKKFYVHRIIKLSFDKFTTKGDCFTESKLYEIDVPIQNIKSKVIWRFPKK